MHKGLATMPLLPRDKPPSAEPKHRSSLLAFLFVPNVKGGISPIGETARVFVQMMAMLFVANKLFPKDHPGLRPNSPVRLRLSEVIGTAYRNLSYTKEKLPQVLFFYAAISCMVVAALAVLLAIFSLMIGRAHAQTAFFSPPAQATNDLGQAFINYLFQGQTTTTLDTNSGASPLNSGTTSTIIQCGLYTALGFYSDALLIIGAMVLFYHLAWMTVETAHHGQVMGKRGNQIWAPIRLVFAVGLLVPIGGTPPAGCSNGGGTGLNAGQILVIAIAQWGNGLASQVWQKFLDQLANDQAQFVPPPAPAVRKVVTDLMMMYACQWAYDWEIDGRIADTDGNTPPNPSGGQPGNQLALISYYNDAATTADIYEPNTTGDGYPPAPTQQPPYVYQDSAPAAVGNPTTKYIFTNSLHSDLPLCGYYILPGAPQIYDPSMAGPGGGGASPLQGLINSVYQAQSQAFTDLMRNGVYHTAVQDVQYFIQDNENGNYASPPPVQDDIDPLVQGYQIELDDTIQANLGAANMPTEQDLVKALGQDGWVSAGAWFNRVARVQTDLMVAATDGLPVTYPPDPDILKSIGGASAAAAKSGQSVDDNTDTNANSEWTTVSNELGNLKAYYDGMSNNATTQNGGGVAPGMTLQQQMEFSADELGASPAVSCGVMAPLDCMFWIIDHIAGAFGVWHSVPSGGGMENLLGVQFTGADPFAEVAEYGNALVDLGYGCLGYGTIAAFTGNAVSAGFSVPQGQSASPGEVAGQAIGGLIGGAGGIMIIIGGFFFALGFLMAYYVPLIPFIAFFFGVVTWIMSILECVIMVPLVALAHLNPEGDGLPGDMARGAYFLLFQVFLRPVLMVFGLLCGLLVFYIAVAFLNAMFAIAVAGTGGLSHGHFTIARIIFTIIYVMLVVIAANHAFDMVQRLPIASMRWLGSSAELGLQDIESVGGLESRLGVVSTYASQQLTGQIASGAASTGQATGGVVKSLLSKNMPGDTGGGGAGSA